MFDARLLFFSGGTALNDTARELAFRCRDVVHLITPFDSGGSSAALRRAFAMPAVGDIRSRIMALADDRLPAAQAVRFFFAHRLPKVAGPMELSGELELCLRGRHPLQTDIPEPLRGIIQAHIGAFAAAMPGNFPLNGASLGNLVLAGGYLRAGRRLPPVIALFSRLVRARGLVRPVADARAHLAVRLASGEVLIGQHRFTGKEESAIRSPITAIWLTFREDDPTPVDLRLDARTRRRISSAACLCYPIGSFYSSLLANLLPGGVGRAVAAGHGPRIFVPNPLPDPELLGHTVRDQVEILLATLRADAPEAATGALLTHVLADEDDEGYPGGLPEDFLEGRGIRLIRRPLRQSPEPPASARQSSMRLDPARLAEALLSLAPLVRSGQR